MKVSIQDLPRKIIVNKINFENMPAAEHKKIIRKRAPHNYSQIPGWIAVGAGPEDDTLLLRRTTARGEEEKIVHDAQTMYSVHNYGYKALHGEIHECLNQSGDGLGVPEIPRALDHIFHAPALTALAAFTGLDTFLMKSTGAEAVETAVHTALKYWFLKNRKKRAARQSNIPYIVSAKNNFHGRTRMARALSDDPLSRTGFGPLLENIIHIPFGDSGALEKVVAKHRGAIAAFIVEPIQGEAGVWVPPDEYLPHVREICTRESVLLILDEIQTGFGRTGSDWVYEAHGIMPDLLCAGKAAGAGVFPVSFVGGTREIMESIGKNTEGATWSATPSQCVALMAAIKMVSDYDLSRQSQEKGKFFLETLREMRERYPNSITDVRGRGLFVGVDTIYDGERISHALLEEGLWAKETGRDGKTIRLSPPLTATREALTEDLKIFEHVIRKFRNSHNRYTTDDRQRHQQR